MPRAGEKPAQVSGPGRYAKRTDKGTPTQAVRPITGGEYGDNQELRTLQGGAPMNASARTPESQMDAPAPPAVMPTGFGEPSARPQEPVTAGNPMGPGAGAPMLGQPLTTTRWSETMRNIARDNPDGSLDDLIHAMEENGL